ncbi:50S ribosomal protein L31 [Candidatus Woesebacteria bacterium RIFCSPLOWO2_01_FULL_39_23]|uniref:50S ribosomal protein L31 n=1 Tax=Candidatus Woesebacteria bacterium RIFCSPHIGHO2_01_FULL_40_22 TaxID=1802499 RepID=A0A1F7YJ83_9BACT|nr:MAG: 50S ribosomal protein L31 [Candidatus Woesebacteria bacterium RBG_16_40_11]OGM27322.1 MAG: 50S ribosomal protein L31 [Candidatus Woesebacteria bacterium RIFCSPHIGHO2_01_FULL_40_22]OGM36980.1 MAG: 50S ribosomal protein L31 [Candidatus Woesebacteria bacterium RIFCSPHIGHO2_12_FULL_38_9]OGM62494.1 MAG: 50S ribosomal protein L31 [Candidatus Woesebacteria bacterium RIFCSPLOWO2_01_FULL_39_23]
MKTSVHPTWYPEAKVTCACGNVFTVGDTVPEIRVEVCYNCHPYYTGEMKFVDTAGRVDAFLSKKGKAKTNLISKVEKRKLKREKKIQKELERPETLEELRKKTKK